MKEKETNTKSSIAEYSAGFILSLFLTFSAFGLVIAHDNSRHQFISHAILLPLVLLLAVIQMIVQSVFFLHLIEKGRGKINLVIFLFAISAVVTIVFGSLWVMQHLNYNMMPPSIDMYMMRQEQINLR